MKDVYAVKGNVVFTKEIGKYEIFENGYVIVEDKLVKGVYNELMPWLEMYTFPEESKYSDTNYASVYMMKRDCLVMYLLLWRIAFWWMRMKLNLWQEKICLLHTVPTQTVTYQPVLRL